MLRLSHTALAKTTTGYIVNLIASDAQKLDFVSFYYSLSLHSYLVRFLSLALSLEFELETLSENGYLEEESLVLHIPC